MGSAIDATIITVKTSAEIGTTITTTICADGDCGNEIGATGEIGEKFLANLGGQSQVYFSTSSGGRYIDQLINGMAYEAKVGYVSLTEKISLQIAKDVELITIGEVDSVAWVFFRSPITGLVGPSDPLYQLLIQNGIGVFFIP